MSACRYVDTLSMWCFVINKNMEKLRAIYFFMVREGERKSDSYKFCKDNK